MKTSWFEQKQKERGRRALQRQLDYQEEKAAGLVDNTAELVRKAFLHSQTIKQKLAAVRPVESTDKVLEVGSGAHGLIFRFGVELGIGVDPLAVQYRRLFPKLQRNAATIAAIGEKLPFDDSTFDIVLSDNVIDHAAHPLKIVHEIVRVLRPGGLLYFTVNVHHPIYAAVSRAHGIWNALGLKFEISPFADHTVHFGEAGMRSVFAGLPIEIVSQISTVNETRKEQRDSPLRNVDALLKKLFFKNALYEVVAIKN